MLTGKKVAKLLSRGQPGRFFDASGLYLEIVNKATGHWLRRYSLRGEEHYLGLGSAVTFTLSEARERNRKVSQSLTDKVDPLVAKRAQQAALAQQAARSITFGECAEAFFQANEPTWKHRSHTAQWSASVLGKTLNGRAVDPDYCRSLRSLPVAGIDVPIVMSVLRPHWHTKPETMSRVRARIAATLDWAKASGFRSGDNPASLDVIGKLLPARSKVAKVEHFAALPYVDIPAFMAELHLREGMAARALEFLILVAARTSEALGAVWPEFDLAEATWTISGSRMKGGREHRVPLSPHVIALLKSLPREDDVVFVGRQQGKALSRMSLIALMQRMGRGATVHGFRSTFRDWAAERTGYPNHVVEQALAHAIGDKVEAAYRRSDLFAKRRKLIEAWSDYCMSPPVAERGGKNVVSIR